MPRIWQEILSVNEWFRREDQFISQKAIENQWISQKDIIDLCKDVRHKTYGIIV